MILASTLPQLQVYFARRVLVSEAARCTVQYTPKTDRVAAAETLTTNADLRRPNEESDMMARRRCSMKGKWNYCLLDTKKVSA